MTTHESNEQMIREFIAAWSRLDPTELARYFAEDGVYHNIPSGAVTGRSNIERFIAGFTADWTATEWEIVSLVADGDLVIAERIDRTEAGRRQITLLCTGVFEIENGQIKVWRDYFDLWTYIRGAGLWSILKQGVRQARGQ